MTSRVFSHGFAYPDDYDEPDAATSPDAVRSSSPCKDASQSPTPSLSENVPDLTALLISEAENSTHDEDDPDYVPEDPIPIQSARLLRLWMKGSSISWLTSPNGRVQGPGIGAEGGGKEVGVDGRTFSSMRRRFEGGLVGVKMFIIDI